MHTQLSRSLITIGSFVMLIGCGSSASVETEADQISSVPGTPIENKSNRAPVNSGVQVPLNLAKLATVGSNPNAKLNPEHGKPGHDCSIAVGAPLPGSPPSIPTPSPSQTPVAANISQPAAASTTSGLNPAHGQPGHRCDIVVGAPLSSAPSKQPVSPVTTVSTPPLKKVKPGMNPNHGEPGHRCDIAVGEPLNSPRR